MALNPLTDPAEALKRLIPPRSELSHLTARFVDGDHFQDGAGWIGDLPSEPAARMQHLTMLRHAFIASNQIAKVLSRHQAGVMGRPPRWAIQMGSASLAQADAEAVTTWWQQAGIHAMLQQATALLLRDRRVVLRLAIPPLPEDRPAPQTLAEALRLIALVPVAGDAGTVLRDAWEHVQYGVVLGVDTDDQAWTEVTTRQGLHTALRVIRHDADQTVWYPLGGRLLHHMLERPVFVTPQMVRLQQALNLDLTQLVRNINLAGSRERYFLNAKPPGDYIATTADDPLGVLVPQSYPPVYQRFVPRPMAVGAGVVNFVQGSEMLDKDGNAVGVANPNINITDPAPVDGFKLTKDELLWCLYDEADQLHILISGDATASGRSRIEARAAFVESLRQTATALDQAMRWLLETSYALACYLLRRPLPPDLTSTAACVLHAGMLSPAEMLALSQLVQQGLLSHETALQLFGIDDPDGEVRRIREERQARDSSPDPTHHKEMP